MALSPVLKTSPQSSLPAWQHSRWCRAVIQLWTDASPFSPFVVSIRFYFSLSFCFHHPPFICLSVLYCVSSVGTALLTDASLWAKKHPSVSSSLPGLRQSVLNTCSCHRAPSLAPAQKQEPRYEAANLACLFFIINKVWYIGLKQLPSLTSNLSSKKLW